MDQPPKLTVDWALRGLELALRNLGDGPTEQRVRRQFHQVLLAIERQSPPTDEVWPTESSVPPPFPDTRR